MAHTFRALAHPIRLSIVRELVSTKASPVDYVRADCDGASLGTVSHHFRSLSAAGLIEVAQTEQRRGALKHTYRLTPQGQQVARWLDQP